MLTQTDYHRIVALDSAEPPPSLQKIGDQFGVTRERVRQILQATGAPTRLHRSRQKRLKWRQEKERLAEEKKAKLGMLAELWNAGATCEDMKHVFGYRSAANAASRISELRKRHKTFNLRNPDHWTRDPEKVLVKRRKVSKLWLAGASAADIAAKCNYKNAQTVRVTIQHFRRRNPEMFPFRRGVAIPRKV